MWPVTNVSLATEGWRVNGWSLPLIWLIPKKCEVDGFAGPDLEKFRAEIGKI